MGVGFLQSQLLIPPKPKGALNVRYVKEIPTTSNGTNFFDCSVLRFERFSSRFSFSVSMQSDEEEQFGANTNNSEFFWIYLVQFEALHEDSAFFALLKGKKMAFCQWARPR